MAGKLRFPIEPVRAHIRHAQAATEHFKPFEGDAVPALIFVKDQGAYLMSSGQPHDSRPVIDGDNVVYAEGCKLPLIGQDDHDEWAEVYSHVADICGGDDFAEQFPLEDAGLLALLEDAQAKWLEIRLTARTMDLVVMGEKR